MTRKHFIALASCLKVTNASKETCEAIALWLQTQNERFDIPKFLRACGVTT